MVRGQHSGRPLGEGLALLHEDLPLVLEHGAAVLVQALGANMDDAAVVLRLRRPQREHLRLGIQGVARVDRLREGHAPVAQVRQGLLGEVLDREAKDHVHGEQGVYGGGRMSERLRVDAVEVEGVEVHRPGREEGRLSLRQRPPPVVLVASAHREILVEAAPDGCLALGHRSFLQRVEVGGPG